MKKIIVNTLLFSTIAFSMANCGKTNVPCNYEKIDGLSPTCVSDGYKDYYYCKNHNTYAEDVRGEKIIADIEAWKSSSGAGYLPIDSKAHRIFEDKELSPTFIEKGHISGYTCELCDKHFTSIEGSTEIPDKDWYIAAKTAIEITDGVAYLKYKNTSYDITELLVPGVDLNTYELRNSNNEKLTWKTLEAGSEINVYFVKDGSPSYKSRAIVYNEYEFLAPGMKEFLNTENGKTANYLINYYNSGGTVENPTGIKIKWSNRTGKSQNLVVSTNKDYSDPVYQESFAANDTLCYLFNLQPLTTYYLRVSSSDKTDIFKDVFRVSGTLRVINVANVYNMRDIGGYMTESGKRVKYGLYYRSGKLDNINSKGIEDLSALKMKTDLELRLDQGSSSVVPGLNYVKAGLYHWGHCFPNADPNTPAESTSLAGMKLAIQTLAKPSNYPVDVHCSGGADRTATVTFVIEGLLGVSYEDMARDVELTTFSSYGLRLRAPATLVDGVYQYDLNSTMKDQSGFIPSFQLIYNHIQKTYVGEGETFSKGIEKYLINDIGITQAEINSIKEIFLG